MIFLKSIKSSTTATALLVLVFSNTVSIANNNQPLQLADSHAASGKPQPVAAEESIHALLMQGYYAVEVICDAPGGQADTAAEQNYLPGDCTAHLDFTRLSADGRRIVTQRTAFNPTSGLWEKEDQGLIERAQLLSWQSGSWQPVRDNSPRTLIEAVNHDAAIVTTGKGRMLARTITQNLSNKPVSLHAQVSDSKLKPAIRSGDALFPEQAREITLSLQPQSASHVLFTSNQDSSVNQNSYCPGTEKNCNVVQIARQGANWLVPDVQTLQKASMHGVQIVGLPGHPSDSEPLRVFLEADAVPVAGTGGENPGQLPIAGDATWSVADEPAVLAATDANSAVLECRDSDERTSVTTQYEGRLDEVSQTLYVPEPCAVLPGPTVGAVTIADQQPAESAVLTHEPSGRILGNTRWRLVETDGLQRIEMNLPVAVQHHLQSVTTETIILAEQDGVLRAGATVRGFGVSRMNVYNKAAFDALRPAIEKFVSH